MSEKSLLSSKFLFLMIAVSMFLFISSSLFFLQFTNPSFSSKSVLKLILPNNTSAQLKNVNAGKIELPHFSSIPQQSDSNPFNISEEKAVCTKSCSEKEKRVCDDQNQNLLKVFMYDLPVEFHFGLMRWKGNANQTWPNLKNPNKIPQYPGGLNLQHSMEYWLTLDLLASDTTNVNRHCTAIRVKNSSEADVIYVPFFSSLSYNRHSRVRGKANISESVDRLLQKRLVEILLNKDEWKRSGGKDHIIVAHHPNSLLYARRKLGSAMFVLSDFGRYPKEIANLEKDLIAPYMHVVKRVPADESASFDQRPTLIYFKGAIYRKDGGMIRQELYYLLKDEKDVIFTFGTAKGNGINRATKGMASSKFCLNIAGDTPSSNRLFDSIASHCVPVIISDEIELPFEDVLDYSEFSIFVHASDAVKEGYLVKLLRGVNREEWTQKWENLKGIGKHFEYRFPSEPGDAVNMIWKAVCRKVSSVRFGFHRQNRFRRSRSMVLMA